MRLTSASVLLDDLANDRATRIQAIRTSMPGFDWDIPPTDAWPLLSADVLDFSSRDEMLQAINAVAAQATRLAKGQVALARVVEFFQISDDLGRHLLAVNKDAHLGPLSAPRPPSSEQFVEHCHRGHAPEISRTPLRQRGVRRQIEPRSPCCNSLSSQRRWEHS